MHDTDRTTREFESQFENFQPESFQFLESPSNECESFSPGNEAFAPQQEYQEYQEHQEHQEYQENQHYHENQHFGPSQESNNFNEYEEFTPAHEYYSPNEFEQFGNESSPGYEFEMSGSESPLSESEEMEFASQFLEVSNEEELEQFLRRLIRRVGRVAKGVIKSPIGKALGGVLKPLAKAALPLAGKALGTMVGGPLGGFVGGKLASMAGSAMGLELEGLSAEDREFEVARKFVRFASSATKNAINLAPKMPPTAAVKSAVFTASRKHAPGIFRAYNTIIRNTGTGTPRRKCQCRKCRGTAFIQPSYSGDTIPVQVSRNRGQWIRRNGRIVLLGI